MTARFTTITLAPALDRTVRLDSPLLTSDVCRVRDESVEAGGKGLNVAKMLARLGCPVAAGGLLGDANCEPFERMLHNYGIENRFVRVHGETRRNLMLLGTDGVERKINFPAFPDLEFDDYLLRQIALLAVKRTDAVVISGSLPQRFPARAVADLMAELHALGKDIVLDTSGEALSLAAEAGPVLVKPNRKEAAQLLGRSLETDDDMRAACRELAKRHEAAILSDGAGGAWFARGPALYRARPPAVKAVDTTAAGDMLLGAFCSRYFPERILRPEAIALAMAAGAAAVELHASQVPDPARVAELARDVVIERG